MCLFLSFSSYNDISVCFAFVWQIEEISRKKYHLKGLTGSAPGSWPPGSGEDAARLRGANPPAPGSECYIGSKQGFYLVINYMYILVLCIKTYIVADIIPVYSLVKLFCIEVLLAKC